DYEGLIPMPTQALFPDTADVALFGYDAGWHILLVRRRWEPYVDYWALPGGYIETGEDTETAARRELAEETNVACHELRPVGRYATPGRDPRGLVTVAYWGIVPSATGPVGGCPRPEPADDAADARWWSINWLPALAYDHGDIAADAVQMLCTRHWAKGDE